MAEFKVGDRVVTTDHRWNISDCTEYSYLTPGTELVISDVRPWGEVLIEVLIEGHEGDEGWSTSRFALVSPRKDTPKVGDTVRVVLEGVVKADSFHHVDDAFLLGASPNGNLINRTADHVKSIEILKPAKPSVKDLPMDSVVKERCGSEVYVKIGANMPKPWTSKWGTRHTDEQIDAVDWVQLVPKESE